MFAKDNAPTLSNQDANHRRRAAIWLIGLVCLVVMAAAWLGHILTNWSPPDKEMAGPEIFPTPIFSPSPNTVVEILDGDTFRLASGATVRYIGIDAPEIKHGQRPAECFGEQSTQIHANLVFNQEVRLEIDRSPTDKYGRLLRYVWVGDRLINQVLLDEGAAIAKAYPPDTARKAQFASAAAAAKDQKIGLWGACN